VAIRRLNYTGRKRIRREDVCITIFESDDSPPRFEARLNLGTYELPHEAQVFVEAYRQTTWMRFRFGTVGNVQPEDPLLLTDFGSPEGVLFRVRVSSLENPRGKLLAEADRIHPRKPDEQEQSRIPLLSVVPSADLGEEVFRVDFSDRPILLVNAKIPDWKVATRTPVFVSLVYPAVLREILARILHLGHPGEIEEDGDWHSQWLRFATLLPGMSTDVPASDNQEAADRWIDEAVGAFCRQHKMMQHFAQYWNGEG